VKPLAERLGEQLGDIDIYLFDQILRGRVTEGMRVLDAGCGGGRKIVLLLREGFDVWGVDESPERIAQIRELAKRLAPRLGANRFRVEPVEAIVRTKTNPEAAAMARNAGHA